MAAETEDDQTTWRDEAARLFEPGKKIRLPRPVRGFYLVEAGKLVYAPVAKSACTSIKSLLVELSGIPHGDFIVANGVHRVTNGFVTGMQLGDYDFDTVERVFGSEEYYKFTVVREPVSRVISAYTDKFVRNRKEPDNMAITLQPVRAIQGSDTPDFQRGVSFREFVEFLCKSHPEDLDGHWGFQTRFLSGPDRYDAVFAMENLSGLGQVLSSRLGREVELARHNRSLSGEPGGTSRAAGQCVDMRPEELDAIDDLSSRDFRSPELVQLLEDYYREDGELHAHALEGLSGYVPRQLALDSAERCHFEPEQIAKAVRIHSKGFFAVKDGVLVLEVALINFSLRSVDFTARSGCYLRCTLRDSNGTILNPIVSQPVELEQLDAGHARAAYVMIELPPGVEDAVQSMSVSLQLGDTFRAEDVAPMSFTAAHRLQRLS